MIIITDSGTKEEDDVGNDEPSKLAFKSEDRDLDSWGVNVSLSRRRSERRK